MNRKIPPDAFTFYASLGPGRSYQQVADNFQVSKRAVTAVANREGWQARMAEIEEKAREKADEKVLETLEDMNGRHLKVMRFIQNKAIEALKSMPIESAMDAVRAYGMTLDKERTIRGEPTDRSAVSVEEIIKRETSRWLTVEGEPGSGESDETAA